MSVIADFGVNARFPSKVGGTGTTVKYFPRLLGSSIGAVPATPSATNPAGMLLLPGDDKLNATQFDVVATGVQGNDSGDPSQAVNIILYAVTGTLTAPIYTQLYDADSTVPGNASGFNSWAITCHLYGDTLSGIVGGKGESYINGILDGPDTVDNRLSGINFNSGNLAFGSGGGSGIPFGLVVGVQFAFSDPTNSASLYQFQVQAS
jgi:hypothetical protein